jgi:hypothetical protein
MTLEELSWFVDDTVKRALQGQTGIGRVDRYGGADREVRIELNPDKLNAYGITAASVNQQLRGTNVDLGSGRGQVGGSEQAIRVLGDARNVAELANTTIALPNGRFVKPLRPRRHQGHLRGAEILLALQQHACRHLRRLPLQGRQRSQRRRNRVEEPRPRCGPKTRTSSIELIDDSVYFTYGNYEAAMHTLLEGACSPSSSCSCSCGTGARR